MFLETALSFPTLLFTVAVVVTVGYWLLSLLTGIGEGLELDLGDGVDVIDGGVMSTLLGGLHLTGVPPVIVFSLTATFGWLVSYTASLLLGVPGEGGPLTVLAAVGVGAGALVVGLLVAAVVARPLARVFAFERAPRNASLLGRTCVVRTGSVSEDFGQAEVTLPGGTVLLVQVRAPVPNTFARGAPALLVDHDSDAGTFTITPDELASLDVDPPRSP